ncbi:hypothetical protein PENANT_c067G11654 [Penicillium antarcticum]|uniref:Uncharacterized protein n=1 Tax=Penicillium antarcticum TaxID=416450 RepID=A0A1V6PR28_9EURO|nr:hypothetical protein PENANT_c067G11654 [Penicillium antarcticum]
MPASRASHTSENSYLNSNVRKRVYQAAMDSAPVRDVELTMASAFLEGGSKRVIKYVEKLEKQQNLLVHGLQELYRRSVKGEDCPSGRLETQCNGQPIIQDLLVRLGVLDETKGEQFSENEGLQQDLSRTNADTQRQPSPIASSRFSCDALHRQHTSPMLRMYGSLLGTRINPEPQMLKAPQSAAPSSMQGAINPLELHCGQQRASNGFNNFNPLDNMSMPDYYNISLGDSYILDRLVPMKCTAQGLYQDVNDDRGDYGDCGDFNQYLHPNTTKSALSGLEGAFSIPTL